MHTRLFRQVDVFGSGPFRGNPVAVILDAEVQHPALRVGEAHRREHEVALVQRLTIALELDRQRLARRQGIKVLLSGAGGDDIFSGYRRHRALSLERYWARLPAALPGAAVEPGLLAAQAGRELDLLMPAIPGLGENIDIQA